MDREEIKTYLPHREPMLLVDSIVVETETAADGTEQHYAVATYKVRGDEFFIQGHFPDYPVVPGVILCEMMAQSCALLLGDEIKSKRPLYTGIDNVRFKHQVRPGRHHCHPLHYHRSSSGYCLCQGRGQGRW